MSKVNIVLAGDENFAMPLAVSLCSCINHLSSYSEIGFRIVDGGILPASKKRIEDKATNSAGIDTLDLEWIHGSDELLPDMEGYIFRNTNFNKTNLYRMAMSKIVDRDCETCIFLDGDIIVKDDVMKLAHELNDSTFVAVRDYGMPTFENRFKGEIPEWIQSEPETKYLNAGVFAADMLAWREENWSQSLFSIFEKHMDICRWPDQDCLNFFLAGRWKEAGLEWNVQTGAPDRMHRLGAKEIDYLGDQYDAIRSRAKIIHFTGIKPWKQGFTNPDRPNWVRALKESEWFTPLELYQWKAAWWCNTARRAAKRILNQIKSS